MLYEVILDYKCYLLISIIFLFVNVVISDICINASIPLLRITTYINASDPLLKINASIPLLRITTYINVSYPLLKINASIPLLSMPLSHFLLSMPLSHFLLRKTSIIILCIHVILPLIINTL